jgi:DNA-directed RNA polymerase specialized sigma subunit
MSTRQLATPKQIAKARKLFAAQVDVPTIIKRTGLTRRQVGYHCQDMPTPKHPRERDCDDVQAAVNALAKELGRAPSCREVGEVLGTSKQAAHALMQRCEITRPTPIAAALARSKDAARKEKQRQAVLAKVVARDAKIIALRKSERTQGKPRRTQAEIAEMVGCHVNTVGRVLRAAGL